MSKHHTNSRNMQKVSAEFREQCSTEVQPDGSTGRPCWLCGYPIDYTLQSGTGIEESYERDHYYPASTHPHLYEDPSNFRPSHAACNRERSNNPPAPDLGILSRSW